MSEQKHSPLPWFVKPDEAGVVCCYGDNCDLVICDTACDAVQVLPRDEANAALIVECVNAHAALKAQRDELLACVETLLSMFPLCDFNDRTHIESSCYLCRARALVRAVPDPRSEGEAT